MNIFSRERWFQKCCIAVFVLFMGIFALVITTAYTRRSGNTGLDMAKIQQIRYSAKKAQ